MVAVVVAVTRGHVRVVAGRLGCIQVVGVGPRVVP